MRKATANQIFLNIEDIEEVIKNDIVKREKNFEAIKQLYGYEWIKTQFKKITELKLSCIIDGIIIKMKR